MIHNRHERLIGWCAFVLVSLLLSCASQLPRSERDKTTDMGIVDLQMISYRDLASGQPVTLGDYMEQNELNYLLLSHGSVGCAQCNIKAKTISESYLHSHALFISSSANSFELVGIATDSGGAKKQFLNIWTDEKTRKERGYDFVQWLDEGGQQLREHIITDSEPYGVPYMILVDRLGRVMMRVPNNDHRDVGRIFDQVAQLIGINMGPPIHPKPPSKPPVQPVPEGFLRVQLPGDQRFADAVGKTCGGEPVNLQAYFAGADLQVLQLVEGGCDQQCMNNLQEVRRWQQDCSQAQSCRAMTLIQSQVSETFCDTTDVLGHDENLRAVFSDLYTWTHEPELNDGVPVAVPPVVGPMVLAFDRSGQIRMVKAGAVTRQDLRDVQQSLTQPVLNRHSNFQVYGDNPQAEFVGRIGFAELRKQAKYTVVAGFDPGCGSCVEELRHWSQPDLGGQDPRLMEYCKKSGGLCQVLALETYSWTGRGLTTPAELYQQIKDEMQVLDLNVPVVVDQEEVGDGFSRFFEGYLAPMHRSTWPVGEPGTVIYDREGKILAAFKSEGATEVDPVLETLKVLSSYE